MNKSTPTFKSLKTFIFDFDGVILDSLNCKTQAFYQLYLPFGKDVAEKVKDYHINNGGVSRFEKFKYWHKNYLDQDISNKEIEKLANKFSEIVFDKVVTSNQIKGSFDFIKKYHEDYQFFIISGTPDDEIKKITKELKIDNYFKEILGSPKDKFQWCEYLSSKYDLKTNETIFLGDALSDFNAAKKFGFHFALRTESYNKELFRFKDLELDFKTFPELEDKLNYPRPKILVTTTSFQDSPGEHHDLLKRQNWEIDFLRGPLKKEEILVVVDQYDGILCGDDEYDKEVIKKGLKGRLKILSKYGVGLDKIDIEAAQEFGIKVTNCPGINQVSVAEHVIALLFSFEKNIPSQFNSVKRGRWDRKVGHEIRGKKLGVIGLGAIGKELAILAKNIGLEVSFFDINKATEFTKKHPEINFQELESLIKSSDYISLHLPLNKKTKGLINQKFFSLMKKDVLIVNTARSGLIDKKDLVSALDKQLIRGYLCDVLDVEPISENEELLKFENVLITPHVGSRTLQNIEKQGMKSLKNLISQLK